MISFFWRFVYGIAIVLLLNACSGAQPMRFRSEVDSLAAPEASQKKHFVILPGNKEINEADLQFLEFKAYVERALVSRGFSKATSLKDGDMVLMLSYGVGAPEIRQYSYDVPVWVDSGFYYPYYRRSRFYGGVNTGYTQRVESYTTYKRYLVLEAYDAAPYREQKLLQLWKTNVTSTGNSNDLRLVFPYMVAAMLPYIGTNTGHMINTDIGEFDPLVRGVIMPPAQQSPIPQDKR